jgi:deazaflavin-dependent oxidoreductase (nitroreductase family)
MTAAVDQRGVAARYDKVLEPQTLELMRRSFKQMNKGMVPLWRLGLARMMNSWPEGSGRMLVLEHVGRVSGTPYRAPVNYAVIEDDIYVLAAFGEKTHWYRNILAAPETAIWMPDGRWLARAEDASDDPERLAIVRQILINSGFVAPMVGLHPCEMSDETLDEATAMYRILRLHPLHEEASADGPGSLVWVWAVAGMALLAALIAGVLLRRLQSER